MDKAITIVGAGLAGSLLACALGRMGYRVRVYERRSDPRAKGYVGGRSINLALSARGIRGLESVGIAAEIMKNAIPMRGRMMHSPTGALAFQYYSKNHGAAINSVSRGGLNLALIHAAAATPGVELFFDHRCVDVDLVGGECTFKDERGEGVVRVGADLVVGTDGAFSAVRAKMQIQERFDYEQAYLRHGYKELHIPPVQSRTGEAEFALDPNALHIWPRGGSMMIALPNRDRSFTCTLFWPYDGPHGFSALRTPQEIETFFRQHYPDAVPLMPTLVQDFQNNPVGSLVTVRCFPWQMNGKVCLLGDAAHAIVPFYGQGMNCAFEDVVCLMECLKKHASASDFGAALVEYQQLRKVNADAIAEMALENFIEMRDKVASRAFRWKKKLDHGLHALMPKTFVPLYDMVSFSTIPYAEARRRARNQWRFVKNYAISALVILAGILTGAFFALMR